MGSTVMSNNYANRIVYLMRYVTLAIEKVTYDSNVGKFILTYITGIENPSSGFDKYIHFPLISYSFHHTILFLFSKFVNINFKRHSEYIKMPFKNII